MHSRFFISLILFLPTFAHANIIADANLMMSYFSASCPSQGPWTQQALQSSGNLVTVLQAIQADPDCRTLSGALTQLQTLNSVFNNMSQDPNQTQISSLQQEQQEILMLSQHSGDPANVAALNSQLQSVNIELASAKGSQLAYQSFQTTRSQGLALQNVVQGASALLTQASQSPLCIQKNPSVLPAIASLAGSAGAALSTGGYSLLVAAGADIINSLVQAARDRKINRQIRQMSLPNSAAAYACVLESLSNQWCSSQDGFEIATLAEQARSKADHDHPTAIERGIKLLNRDYHNLLAWLTSVQAGTDPANTSMANRQSNFIMEETFAKAGRSAGLGLIADNKSVYDGLQNDSERWTDIQTLADSIVGQVIPYNNGGGGPNNNYNPFALAFGTDSRTIATWYLVGIDSAQIPQKTSGGRLDVSDFDYTKMLTQFPGYKVNIDTVSGRFANWVIMAQNRVDLDRKRVMYADPCKLIMDAITPEIDGESPYESMDALITFMSESTPPRFQGIYLDTVASMKKIKDQVDLIANSSCDKTSAQNAVNSIFDTAQLQNGTGYIGERLVWALRMNLNQMVNNPQGGVSDAQDTVLLAAQDLVQVLRQYAGEDQSFTQIGLDAKTSQSVLESTLQNFADVFGPQISDALDYYKTQMDEKGEAQPTITNTLDSKIGGDAIALSKMCLLLLSVPEWPEDVPEEICYGRLLNSMSAQGPISKIIGPSLIHSNYRSRMCVFSDYVRANNLFDKFHEQGLDHILKVQ